MIFFPAKPQISSYIAVKVLSAFVSSNSQENSNIMIPFCSFLFTSTKVSIQ